MTAPGAGIFPAGGGIAPLKQSGCDQVKEAIVQIQEFNPQKVFFTNKQNSSECAPYPPLFKLSL